jgi:hypothetical protein
MNLLLTKSQIMDEKKVYDQLSQKKGNMTMEELKAFNRA